jgi:methylglutaconyl-CoA hydratase
VQKTDPHVEIEIADGLAKVWLARPERRNALDPTVLEQLGLALQALAADPRVQVVVLGGRGSAFCAGADLNWMARAAGYTREQNVDDAQQLARLLKTLDDMPKPTLARVHGACYAGAIGLVAACDLAVAADDARFCFSEVRLGLVPATISPYVVRTMGYRSSLQLMLTAEVFDAASAQRLSLVNEVVSGAALDSRVDAIAARLGEAGPRASAETKQLLREIAGKPLDDRLRQRTVECIADARASQEGREGLRAMLAAETPNWRKR